MSLSVIVCFRVQLGCLLGECLKSRHYWSVPCLMPYKWPPSAVTTCRCDSGTWIAETMTDTSGVTPCAYLSYIHMFFKYSGKQQCLVKTRCFGGHKDECVRHDWLLWAGEGIWTGLYSWREVDRGTVSDPSWESWTPHVDRSPPPALSSRLHIITSFSSPPSLIIIIITQRDLRCRTSHVLHLLRMLDRSISVHSWGTSGFSTMRCHSRCSSPYESIQSTSFP